MNESIGIIIMRLRKEHGMTQDQLANALGITFQAVSKWENGVSSPDISTLPLLADLFGVTVDQLLGRDALPAAEERLDALVPVETQPEPETETREDPEPGLPEADQILPWPDDDCFYAVLYHGHSLVGHLAGDPDLLPAKKHFVFSYEGPAQNIFSDFSVEIHGAVKGVRGVLGDVKAGESVDCGDVGGSVSAGGNVNCSDVGGSVSAGVSAKCGDVEGSVMSGFGRAKAKPWDEESFDRDLDDLIDREIEKAQKAAERASDFGEDLGRRISETVERAMSFRFGFGKKNRDEEE